MGAGASTTDQTNLFRHLKQTYESKKGQMDDEQLYRFLKNEFMQMNAVFSSISSKASGQKGFNCDLLPNSGKLRQSLKRRPGSMRRGQGKEWVEGLQKSKKDSLRDSFRKSVKFQKERRSQKFDEKMIAQMRQAQNLGPSESNAPTTGDKAQTNSSHPLATAPGLTEAS